MILTICFLRSKSALMRSTRSDTCKMPFWDISFSNFSFFSLIPSRGNAALPFDLFSMSSGKKISTGEVVICFGFADSAD